MMRRPSTTAAPSTGGAGVGPAARRAGLPSLGSDTVGGVPNDAEATDGGAMDEPGRKGVVLLTLGMLAVFVVAPLAMGAGLLILVAGADRPDSTAWLTGVWLGVAGGLLLELVGVVLAAVGAIRLARSRAERDAWRQRSHDWGGADPRH